jgi:hypothetical protein
MPELICPNNHPSGTYGYCEEQGCIYSRSYLPEEAPDTPVNNKKELRERIAKEIQSLRVIDAKHTEPLFDGIIPPREYSEVGRQNMRAVLDAIMNLIDQHDRELLAAVTAAGPKDVDKPMGTANFGATMNNTNAAWRAAIQAEREKLK